MTEQKHTHSEECYPNPSEFVPPPADLRNALAEAFADRHNATTERDHLRTVNAALLDALLDLLPVVPSSSEMRLLAVRIQGSDREIIDQFMSVYGLIDERVAAAREAIRLATEGDTNAHDA